MTDKMLLRTFGGKRFTISSTERCSPYSVGCIRAKEMSRAPKKTHDFKNAPNGHAQGPEKDIER